MKTLLCDMDGILVNLFTYWIDAINRRHGTNTKPEDVTDWAHEKAYPTLSPASVYAFLQEPGFFLNAPALPGALEGLKALHDARDAAGNRRYDVLILSSPSGPVSAAEKFQWLARELPWLSPKNVMLANRKTLVRGDLLIDDRAETLLEYQKTWPNARALGIAYPYNEGWRGAIELHGSWRDTAHAWENIVGHLA